MLQAIRERVTGIVAIFILGLLAVPFLFFGLESYISSVPQDAVATVGEVEISSSEFQTSFARYRAELRQQQGDAYDEIATNQPMFRRQHLEQMIDEALLRAHADSMGLTVSAGMLRDIIARIPAFQIEGEFNSEAYRQALRASGRTPRGFEQELRSDILTSLLPTAVSASTVVTEAEVDRLLSLQNETRQISLVNVAIEPFRDQVEVTDAGISEYYEANQNEFLTTEQVSVRYVELDTRELTSDLELTEDELLQRYEAASQRYLTPEARQASHILIETGSARSEEEAQALAMQVYERALEGEAFSDLAAEFSEDPGSAGQGGDLGWIEPGDMVEAFEDALFGLTFSGELSEPVRSPFGWHIIQLNDIREPEGMSFEEARPEILAEYREREAEALYIELSDRLVDLVFEDASNIEPLAEELGLDIQQTEPFPRSGAAQGIASNPRVAEAAFSDLVLLDGSVSDPIELDRNQLVVLQVAEHLQAEPRPLSEVSERIRERLVAQGARELARQRAEDLKAAAESEGLAVVAEADEELILVEHPQVGRFDFQHGPQLVSELFRLPPPDGGNSLHVLPSMQGFAVVSLESVQPGNPVEATEQERDLIRQQIRFRQANEEVLGLLAYLRENTEIRVVEDRL
jgi:peptidyl-prolyl cis-trans isomerase D